MAIDLILCARVCRQAVRQAAGGTAGPGSVRPAFTMLDRSYYYSGRCVATDFSQRSARLRPSSGGARHETDRAPPAVAIRPFVAS